MKKKFIILLIFSIIIVLGLSGVIYFLYNGGFFFNPGDRYEWSKLDYMDIIYENRSDIRTCPLGYSETEDCPWDFIHNGLDFAFRNETNVIAAAPGQVQEIEKHDYEGPNKYHVRIWIRFNRQIRLGYNFEPWTDKESEREKQIEMFQVEIGDWVYQGQVIAKFLECNEYAHIHFDVIENHNRYCSSKYFSTEGYVEIMELIQSYYPTRQLCYL